MTGVGLHSSSTPDCKRRLCASVFVNSPLTQHLCKSHHKPCAVVTDTFGVVDTVVKRGGQAYIELGPGAEALLQPPPDVDSASTSSTRGATEAADAADAEVAAAPSAAAGAPTAAGRKTPGRRGRPRKTAAAAAE